MKPEDLVYDRLRSNSDLFALVSKNAANEPAIFPAKPSQDTPVAYVVFTRTGSARPKFLDGTSSLRYAEMTVEAWGKTFNVVRAMLDAVEDALDDHQDIKSGCHGIDAVEGSEFIEETENEFHGQQTYLVVVDD